MLLLGTHVKDEYLELVDLLGITLEENWFSLTQQPLITGWLHLGVEACELAPSALARWPVRPLFRSQLGDHAAKIFWRSFCHV